MYAPFFGLDREPFSIAPDPRLLFMSERHREALAHLLYGIRGGGGFVLLTGEIGTGKTTVCRLFLEQVPAHCNVAYIFNPKLTVSELLQSVCEEFGIGIGVTQAHLPPTVKDYLDPLNAFLLAEHAAGRNNVLVIDEAQNLSAEVLEQLRLLTNLETSERKLLQIILIGQPELRTMLQRPELEQLAQRVIARYHLGALSDTETTQYIQHRLEVSGLHGAMPFDRKALRRIHVLSGGVPRRINLLCDRALLGAFAGSHATVGAAIVEKAAGEVFDRPAPANPLWRRSLSLVGLSVAAGAVLVMVIRVVAPAPAPASAPASIAAAGPAPAAAPAASAPAAVELVVAAPAPAPATTPAPPPESVPTPVLLRAEDDAWNELAVAWAASPASATGRACEALAQQQLQCFSGSTTLAMVRQLGRPGILKLDADRGAPAYALLTGLTQQTATLRAGGTEQTVTLQALAGRWQGDFATLWRAPQGFRGDKAARVRPELQWIATQLSAIDGVPLPSGAVPLDAALKSRLRAFQLAQGLPADGLPGPLTYMQINRVAGVQEPRLRMEP